MFGGREKWEMILYYAIRWFIQVFLTNTQYLGIEKFNHRMRRLEYPGVIHTWSASWILLSESPIIYAWFTDTKPPILSPGWAFSPVCTFRSVIRLADLFGSSLFPVFMEVFGNLTFSLELTRLNSEPPLVGNSDEL